MIKENIEKVRETITLATRCCERDPTLITLLAVSKTKSVTAIQSAIDAGQYCFGENYVQEGVDKIAFFKDTPLLIWHFIGHIQSNKTRLIATHFDWVQTLDRLKVALRLNEQRPINKAPLNVLIQININQESSKAGVTLAELDQLADAITQLPRLTLRGIMAIPEPTADQEYQIQTFTLMHHAFIALKSRYNTVDTLSMGMSHDLAAAICAGSTMVRVGSAIFGDRGQSI